MSSGPPPLPFSSSTPPPLGPSSQAPSLHQPVVLDKGVVPGTEGMTLGDVEQEVLNGGRFVVYVYNFSVLVMSFKRASAIKFLRSNQDGTGSALGYSLLSLLVGPWGFPWGLLWTPLSIFTNLRGGKDVTEPVLQAYLGPERAAEIGRTRRRRSAGWGMMLVRTAFIAAPLALVTSIIIGSETAYRAELALANTPGYAEYQKAHDSTSGSLASGNTKEATDAARKMALGMKLFLDESATHAGSRKTPDHNCGVWCEIRDDRCIVVMRVPDLRRYDSEAQRILAEAAWMDARSCLQQVSSLKQGSPLLVAVRGESLYDSVMTGHLTTDIEAAPEASVGMSKAKSKLIEWFKPGSSREAKTVAPVTETKKPAA